MKKLGVLLVFLVAVTVSTFAYSDSCFSGTSYYNWQGYSDSDSKIINGPDSYVNWRISLEAADHGSYASGSISLDFGVVKQYSLSSNSYGLSTLDRTGGMHNEGSLIYFDTYASVVGRAPGVWAAAYAEVSW